MSTISTHTWKFFRIGGLDQVAIETAEDLLNLDSLDQKLWVALSCPVKGLELDEKTLALVDTDKDGRIRVPELLEAIKWTSKRLKDVSIILKSSSELPVDAINDATPEGAAVLASVRQVMTAVGKASAPAISLEDVSDLNKIFASARFNGDGVITPSAAKDESVVAVIKDIMACLGADKDLGGEEGVTQLKLETFYTDLAGYTAWSAGSEAALTLGAGTAVAAAAVLAVKAKVDDYFTRCRLAAFDSRATGVLNRAEADFAALSGKELTAGAAEIAAFPLAKVDAEASLPLLGGVNPAWSGALAALHRDAVVPVFGAGKRSLSETEWTALLSRVQPFIAWQASKTGASVEKLGLARVNEILGSKAKESILALVAEDKAVAAEFTAIGELERLLRYRRDLSLLLCNFVNFFDFYSKEKHAIFEAGTLYLDSRSTELCVRVDGPNPLAAMSKAFIAYCSCSRVGGATMTIAACFTQGDSDFLFVGRHGVFYDRAGRDWDAVITSIVDNPISIRQAFWSPYKKFIRMIEEQIAKRAAAADAEASGRLATAAEKTANADKAKAEPPKKLDLALITGISVAIGAIGTFLATIFAKVVELKAWQLPLVFLGLMFAISLPAMVIAWLKLRQRNLGPILEANGWAVNGRVMINIPFGTALTDKAVLPANARRSLTDPYEDESGKTARRTSILLVLLAVVVYATVAWHFHFWPWTEAPVTVATTVATTTTVSDKAATTTATTTAVTTTAPGEKASAPAK